MFKKWMIGLSVGLVVCMSLRAEVKTGDAAPAFAAKGSDGKDYKSDDLKGKIIVLEWTSPGCPYVRKQYGSGNMQALQKKYGGKGVIWLAVSTGKSEQDGAKWQKILAERSAAPTTVLLDGDGSVGRAFGAKTTPHMFVVSAEGKIAYQGALDDQASPDQADPSGAKNYVAAAVEALLAGKPVETGTTKPYGCGVKY